MKKWRSEILLFGAAAIVLVLDQWTKVLVERHLPLQQPWNPFDFLRPTVTLNHVTNKGAAFGIFPSASTFFTLVGIIIPIVILIFHRRFPSEFLGMQVALGLQMGGALGNLVDRLTRGHVVDFIDFHFWPVFNVADSSVFIGGVILAYYFLFKIEDEAPQSQELEAEGS